MEKQPAFADPDAYVASLTGWRADLVARLRSTVRDAADLREAIKWGHLVYLANGPVLLIRAEAERVLFGFWRGRRLLHLEPRLKRGGKYEMATITLVEGTEIDAAAVRRLVQTAVALDAEFGDPTKPKSPD